MGRFQFLILAVGAMIVVAAFAYPLWRPAPEGEMVTTALPELRDELQSEFLQLPRPVQALYQLMSEENPSMAAALVEARLRPPEPVVEELPDVGNAQIVSESEFRPLFLSEAETSAGELELPPYNGLYAASGSLSIYAYPDGRVLFRLETFNVINTVDAWVVLTANPKPMTFNDFGGEYVEIAPLKSTTGNMNYELSGVNINDYSALVIYDRRYRVITAFAPIN